jgi:hypothetical protein
MEVTAVAGLLDARLLLLVVFQDYAQNSLKRQVLFAWRKMDRRSTEAGRNAFRRGSDSWFEISVRMAGICSLCPIFFGPWIGCLRNFEASGCSNSLSRLGCSDTAGLDLGSRISLIFCASTLKAADSWSRLRIAY